MNINFFVTLVAIVMLFLFGLQSLSHEIQKLIQGPFNRFFLFATNNRFKALFTGIIATGAIQSSSAVTTLSVALVDSGVLTLKNILGILIGANIGTASTAFLISFKLEFLGAYLIIIGSILSLLPIKIKTFGKSLFYFGFILFLLNEIGYTLKTQFDIDSLTQFLSAISSPPEIILYGFFLSAAFQSSSLITGLAILMVNQNIIGVNFAIYIMLGSNIGTTTTALVASLGLNINAKKAALANFIFNFLGVLIIYPSTNILSLLAFKLSPDNLGMVVAYSHLLFNISLAIIFLPFLDFFNPWLEKINFNKKNRI